MSHDRQVTRQPLLVFLCAVSGLVLAAQVVSAQPAPSTPADTSFWRTLQPYGDIRLRGETDYDSVLADGVTPRADRTRLRTRMRLGVTGGWGDALRFDSRIRQGDRSSQQSPHVTWFQDAGDKGKRAAITLDRLFLKWSHAGMAVTAGRQDFPFWKPHELLWDDDVYLDGAGVNVTALSAVVPVGLRAGVWRLPDGPAHHSFNERSTLAAAQLVFVRDLGPPGTLTVAGAFLAIRDDSAVTSPTNDDLDYGVSALDLQHRFQASGVSATIGASFYHNREAGPASDPVRDATDGVAAFAKLGRFTEPGDLEVAYYFAEIEKYAVARFFAQDDWFRFGNATQTRASDYRGHEIRLSYLWRKNVNLVGRAYFVQTISDRERGNRVRFDLNYRF